VIAKETTPLFVTSIEIEEVKESRVTEFSQKIFMVLQNILKFKISKIQIQNTAHFCLILLDCLETPM